MAKIDRRRFFTANNLPTHEKTQLHTYYITLPEAVVRINQRVPEGYHVSRDLFAHRVSRGTIPCIKVDDAYYFSPEIIDNLTFKPKKHFQQGSITPVQVTSVEELRPLEEKYGPLVDMQGFLSAMQRHTGRPYKVGAIKQRILRGTIVYVAYFGSEKRKHYMFPVNQMYDPDFFKVTKHKSEPQIPEQVGDTEFIQLLHEQEKQYDPVYQQLARNQWDSEELNRMIDMS